MTAYNLGTVVGNGIASIEKTSTSGLVDTYTITCTNGDTYTFTVTNGEGGGGVDIVTSWSSTVSDESVPSEKLAKDTLDTKIDKSDRVDSLDVYASGKVLDARQGNMLDLLKINKSDIANNLTTTSSGKVLDARQGKALADLIGDAILYINQ